MLLTSNERDFERDVKQHCPNCNAKQIDDCMDQRSYACGSCWFWFGEDGTSTKPIFYCGELGIIDCYLLQNASHIMTDSD